jgi:hypothetical protein
MPFSHLLPNNLKLYVVDGKNIMRSQSCGEVEAEPNSAWEQMICMHLPSSLSLLPFTKGDEQPPMEQLVLLVMHPHFFPKFLIT